MAAAAKIADDAVNPPVGAAESPPASPKTGSVRLQALSQSLNAGALSKIEAAIVDEALIDDFKPHMLHKEHELCRE